MTTFYQECNLANGTYRGKQGGYKVQIETEGGMSIWFETEDGLRGMNIPVTVVVKDGEATVTVDK